MIMLRIHWLVLKSLGNKTLLIKEIIKLTPKIIKITTKSYN